MAICRDSLGNRYYCSSMWSDWARWLTLGLVLVAFFFIICLFSCISARRRRKLGRQPMYGTGWAAGAQHGQYPPPQNPPNTYYAYQQPAPPYSPAQGYRNEQQTGIELASPTPAHMGGQKYEPPPGPPPSKFGH